MFEALIRRNSGGRLTADEFAEESTLFTLSTEVPRPAERRTDERIHTILPPARLVTAEANHFCRIKNISAGGLMAEISTPPPVGTALWIELDSAQRVRGIVVWNRPGAVGIKFDQGCDLRELLAKTGGRSGVRPRPPRLEVTCGATVQIGQYYYKVEVRDISLGGMKVAITDWNCTGKDVTVTIESLRPVKGRVRWYRGGYAGIVFDKPLSFEELTNWIGKRLDIASLRTGAWGPSR